MNKNSNMNMFFTHKKGVFFRQVRGSLMHTMVRTRPNIAIGSVQNLDNYTGEQSNEFWCTLCFKYSYWY
jgi:hypothetical protein